MKRKKGKRITAICIAVAAVICAYNGVSYFQKKQRADNSYKHMQQRKKAGKRGALNTHTEPVQKACGLRRLHRLPGIFLY
ncbi:hypothetical protein DXB96_13500 [Clostridium sp. OM07-10AC]|nr:hypothetical protein DXB96_13500 [Clostridium sp. OM07-10AC]